MHIWIRSVSALKLCRHWTTDKSFLYESMLSSFFHFLHPYTPFLKRIPIWISSVLFFFYSVTTVLHRYFGWCMWPRFSICLAPQMDKEKLLECSWGLRNWHRRSRHCTVQRCSTLVTDAPENPDMLETLVVMKDFNESNWVSQLCAIMILGLYLLKQHPVLSPAWMSENLITTIQHFTLTFMFLTLNTLNKAFECHSRTILNALVTGASRYKIK